MKKYLIKWGFMDTLDLMRRRHSVRQYLSKPIEKEKKEIINNTINFINQKTGLNFKACYDEPTAFKSLLAHYGKFKNVNNYIVLAGDKKQEELVGYYGEILVLTTQELGLNTCWVALTYNKKSVNINLGESEKIHCVIALGYGVTPGVQSKCKEYDEVVKVIGEKPNYLDAGIEACMLAPTAMNQQKFKIICENGKISIKKSGIGFYTDMDLGIVKCHFEMVTGVDLLNN